MATSTYVGLIRAGDFKIAFPADQLQEVVLHPGSLSPLPDAGDCMDGTFLLRGRTVPVLNLMRLLGVEASAVPFIAVTLHDGKLLGLAIGEILNVRAIASEAQFEMAGEASAQRRLFTRCFHDSQDGSLIQFLDLAALHSWEGVRVAVKPEGVDDTEETTDDSSLHLALFSVGGRSFGVERSSVWKALPAQQITERVSDIGLLRGYLRDNDTTVPILDLLGLLRISATTESAKLGQSILFQHGERKVGFEIDGVIGSTKISARSLAPVGGSSSLGATPFVRSGCRMLNSKDHGLVIVLDFPALLQQEELRNATANQRRPVAGMIRKAEAESTSKPAVSFVTYFVGASRFCTPLVEVEAIVPLPEFLSFSDGGDYFCGVMEWRSKVVNLFDLNVLLGTGGTQAPSEAQSNGRRVLIVSSVGPLGPEFRGFVVDAVEALTSAVTESIPSLVTSSWAARGGPACPSITEMIQISGAGDGRSNVNVLHLTACEAPLSVPLALTA